MVNPPDCSGCGATLSTKNKNTMGHYRDLCWDCILDEAAVDADAAKRQSPPDYDK